MRTIYYRFQNQEILYFDYFIGWIVESKIHVIVSSVFCRNILWFCNIVKLWKWKPYECAVNIECVVNVLQTSGASWGLQWFAESSSCSTSRATRQCAVQEWRCPWRAPLRTASPQIQQIQQIQQTPETPVIHRVPLQAASLSCEGVSRAVCRTCDPASLN